MKTQHTPGNWQVIRERDRISGEQRIFIGLKGLTVAEILPGLPKNEEAANAALLASAPTLLDQREALREALKEIAGMAEDGRQTVNELRAAVMACEADSAAAVTRGSFMAITDKARTALAKLEAGK